MISLQRILAVVRKELIQLRRDRLTFGMIVGIPAAQLLLFGYAINMDPRNLDAAVADLSASAASREIVMDLSRSQVVNLRYQVGSAAELEALLRQGRISVGLFIPADYERRLQQPGRAAAQLLIDGSDTVVQGAAASLAKPARTSPYNDRPPQLEIRTYYNPERRSAVNTVPGLIGDRVDQGLEVAPAPGDQDQDAQGPVPGREPGLRVTHGPCLRHRRPRARPRHDPQGAVFVPCP